GLLQNPSDHARLINGGRSVGHANDAGETTGGRGLRSAGDRFLGRLTGFAEMDVKIDQPRAHDQTAGVDDLDLLVVLPRGTFEVDPFDSSPGEVNIADAMNPVGRV